MDDGPPEHLRSFSDLEDRGLSASRIRAVVRWHRSPKPSLNRRRMRIVVVSRIFAPEPSAASLILHATVVAFQELGHEVVVLTTKPPRGTTSDVDPPGAVVRRWPVKRDRHGYVRGYVSYMSFDIPVFFRLVLGRRADLYLVEPPPTTGAVVRVAAMLRRVPYVYDAADLWADAAALATSNPLVLRLLRLVEGFAIRGARRSFAISEGLVARMRALKIDTPASVVGFGADTGQFRYLRTPAPTEPFFVYGGSYSEWHGAGVFLDAFEEVVRDFPRARLLFVGNGQERPSLEAVVRSKGLSGVEFRASIPPADLSRLFNEATAALASVRPGSGYEYAFATKIYSSLASGCPVIFSGSGPTAEFIDRHSPQQPLGVATSYTPSRVAHAMLEFARRPLLDADRASLAAWAAEKFSLIEVGRRIARESVVAAQTERPASR